MKQLRSLFSETGISSLFYGFRAVSGSESGAYQLCSLTLPAVPGDGWFGRCEFCLVTVESSGADFREKNANLRESLSMLMRRCHICEEEGSGWDKVIIAAEENLLPAPRIINYSESTKVIVRGFVPLDKMSIDEKTWSCYLHACLKYSMNEMITNTSLRERFGAPETTKATISRIIKISIEKGLIKPFEVKTAPRYMKYIPLWA